MTGTTASASVQRALHILLHLADEPQTISELGRRLDVHRATAMRILRTLEHEGFVRQLEDRRFQLGPRLLMLSQAAAQSTDLPVVARRHLTSLGERCGQTVHLASVTDGSIVYVDKVESRQVIRMYSRIGAVAPPHATGVGKVILAHAATTERDLLLGTEPFHRFTDTTLVDRRHLDTELDAIVRRGWALDDFEHEPLIHCVAAPVRDATSAVRTGVSISAPRMVVDRADLLAFVPDLRATADAISRELGWESDD